MDPDDIALCLEDDVPVTPSGGKPTSTPVVLTSLFRFGTLDALLDALAHAFGSR